MFELCAGIPFFLANSEDNIQADSMFELFCFTDATKKKRLSEIHNTQARNLVAQMLTKDPLLRPTMAQILQHPFLTGQNAARMVISYMNSMYCIFIHIHTYPSVFDVDIRLERKPFTMCSFHIVSRVTVILQSFFMRH